MSLGFGPGRLGEGRYLRVNADEGFSAVVELLLEGNDDHLHALG